MIRAVTLVLAARLWLAAQDSTSVAGLINYFPVSLLVGGYEAPKGALALSQPRAEK